MVNSSIIYKKKIIGMAKVTIIVKQRVLIMGGQGFGAWEIGANDVSLEEVVIGRSISDITTKSFQQGGGTRVAQVLVRVALQKAL